MQEVKAELHEVKKRLKAEQRRASLKEEELQEARREQSVCRQLACLQGPLAGCDREGCCCCRRRRCRSYCCRARPAVPVAAGVRLGLHSHASCMPGAKGVGLTFRARPLRTQP